MTITKDKAAEIIFTVKDTDGNVLDSNAGKDPLTYIHGYNTLMPGMEKALEGKAAGDKVAASVPPEDGFGEHNPDMVQDMPAEKFGDKELVKAGARFRVSYKERDCVVTVLEVNGETAKVDFNNPLAGKTVDVEIEVVNVREATEAELKRTHDQVDLAVKEMSQE